MLLVDVSMFPFAIEAIPAEMLLSNFLPEAISHRLFEHGSN